MAVQPVNMEKCSRCGMCENFCPMDVIRIEHETRQPYIAYLEDCMLCGLCEARCPSKAITVTPDRVAPLLVCWR